MNYLMFACEVKILTLSFTCISWVDSQPLTNAGTQMFYTSFTFAKVFSGVPAFTSISVCWFNTGITVVMECTAAVLSCNITGVIRCKWEGSRNHFATLITCIWLLLGSHGLMDNVFWVLIQEFLPFITHGMMVLWESFSGEAVIHPHCFSLGFCLRNRDRTSVI